MVVSNIYIVHVRYYMYMYMCIIFCVCSDLEYGLPVQVRDHALAIKDTTPKSDVNKEYYLQNLDNQVSLKIDNLRENNVP